MKWPKRARGGEIPQRQGLEGPGLMLSPPQRMWRDANGDEWVEDLGADESTEEQA